jgi:tetratricopeptide (TPR) repeat protein
MGEGRPMDVDELRRRVERDPASIAFAALAEEYRRLARYAEAEATCRAGLEHHPAYHSARVTLARCLLEQGDPSAARGEFEQVLRASPQNLLARKGLAEVLQRQGDPRGALAELRLAVALAPQQTELLETIERLEHEIQSSEVRELDIPELDVSQPDAAGFEAPRFEVPDFEAADLEAPDLDVPELEAPDFEVPVLELPVASFDPPSVGPAAIDPDRPEPDTPGGGLVQAEPAAGIAESESGPADPGEPLLLQAQDAAGSRGFMALEPLEGDVRPVSRNLGRRAMLEVVAPVAAEPAEELEPVLAAGPDRGCDAAVHDDANAQRQLAALQDLLTLIETSRNRVRRHL